MDFFEPRISADTKEFWEGCRAHELRIQKCKSCGRLRWPAGRFCPDCLSEETELAVLPPEGTIYSYVIMEKPFHPSLKEKVPYVVAAVDVAEDVRILVNMFDCEPENIHCGDTVEIDFLDSETYSRPVAKYKEETRK